MDKRNLAKAHRGVWYDPRVDKFVAEIYIDGAKRHLGTFAEVEDAARVYQTARAERPPVRRARLEPSGPAFAEVVAPLEPLAPGDIAEFRGQHFVFAKTTFRRFGGRALPFFVWTSECLDCGGTYETMTSAGGAKGITRRCEAHRKAQRGAVKAVIDLQADVDVFEVLHGAVPFGLNTPENAAAREFFSEFLRSRHPGRWAGWRDAWRDGVLWRSTL